MTEEVTGVDLVTAADRDRRRRDPCGLGLDAADASRPRGYALKLRVNLETMGADGDASRRRHDRGLRAAVRPRRPRRRFGYAGYRTGAASTRCWPS